MTTTPTQADRPVDPADIEAVARSLQGAFTGYLGYGDASELAVAAIDTLIARGNHSALAASEARDVVELTDEQWYDLAQRHANADWNSDDADGYLNSVKTLCSDFRSLATRASEAAPHVGESRFEGWYADYLLSAPVHQEPKQRARDAYAAGMGEAAPVVVGDAIWKSIPILPPVETMDYYGEQFSAPVLLHNGAKILDHVARWSFVEDGWVGSQFSGGPSPADYEWLNETPVRWMLLADAALASQDADDLEALKHDLDRYIKIANAEATLADARQLIIDEVHAWAVCAAITTPEDMAQNFAHIAEITAPQADATKGEPA